MQEFQIQSNIPVLILTIALIVITILGFLEFKKLSNRIDSMISNIDSISSPYNDNNNGGGSDTCYTKSGNNITMNLNHSNFAKLNSDGWFNLYQEKVLILKISSSSYRAFEGRCPHQGVSTAWSFNSSNNEFRCGQHDSDFKADCSTPAAQPNTGARSGSLKCFSTSLNGNSLTITKS